MRFLFSIGLFLSAVLFFIIQPMAAKIILPIFGGTPAVWVVCMLFFQILLLLAYGYSHLLSRLSPTGWRLVHLGLILLAIFYWPFTLKPIYVPEAPDFAILKLLLKQLAIPLLILAASAPLLQFAYSYRRTKDAKDPYSLYVASNLGSLLALMSYPWLVERYLPLSSQLYYWNYGFIFYLCLVGFLFFAFQYKREVDLVFCKTPLEKNQVLKWIAYSFIPCSLLLSVTFYISSDVAPTPLFWVLPFALYLLTFVISFARKPVISSEWINRNLLFFLIFPLLAFIWGPVETRIGEVVIFHLLGFFILALLCHSELVKLRPKVNYLTSYYLCIALGGALAGVFNGLIAPRFFSGAYEYPLIFALSMLVVSFPQKKKNYGLPIVIFILLLIGYLLPANEVFNWFKKNHAIEILSLIILLIWSASRFTLFAGMSILLFFLFSPLFNQNEIIDQQRNFYGIKQVVATSGLHALISKSTVHGFQFMTGEIGRGDQAYYGPPLVAIQRLQQDFPKLNALIVGVGTGMMACQFRANDALQMIDIDRQVLEIAKNPRFFNYIKNCPPKLSLEEGDGRLILSNKKDRGAELIVVDAFSSDAVPIHLLTLEAFKLYQQKINEKGLILVNISNRHLHLLPVVAGAGRELEMIVLYQRHAGDSQLGQFKSEWVALTQNEALASSLMSQGGWRFVAQAETQLWTDDYSNLVSLIRW